MEAAGNSSAMALDPGYSNHMASSNGGLPERRVEQDNSTSAPGNGTSAEETSSEHSEKGAPLQALEQVQPVSAEKSSEGAKANGKTEKEPSQPLYKKSVSPSPSLPSAGSNEHLQPNGQTRELRRSKTPAQNKEEEQSSATELPSDALLPPPPSLPYDLSYAPLSPMGLDQTGRSLALQFPEKAARQASEKVGESSKGKAGNAGSSGLSAGRLPVEKAKKVLPGEELEVHMVSESSGQRPMPWGLKSTLLEKGQGAPRGKTRMGSLKRNAPRHLRSSNGAPVEPLIKMDEDSLSERDSPFVSLADGSDALSGAPTDSYHAIETVSDTGRDSVASTSGDAEKISATQQLDSDTFEAGRERARTPTKKRESITSTGDTSVGSGGGSSRRPREAHKRLKMIGGYYGQNQGRPSTEGILTNGEAGATAVESQNETSAPTSRAPSLAVEDNISDAQHHEEVVDAVMGPSTPSKAPHSSLTVSLRDSASKRQSTKMMHAGTGLVDSGEGNNDFCETCGGVGHFICCDGCPRSFHFACINPPLDIDELPSTMGDENDKWFCNVCRTQRRGKGKGKAGKGLFSLLLQRVEEENPTIFSLPHDIRNYFKGVATANDGTYVDSTMLRPIKVNRFGLVDERDPLRLRDRNGKLILCYRCGQSAMPSTEDPSTVDVDALSESQRKGWRNIIGCDFCTSHWHLDCLDPPLASMPSLSRKWMCPTHVEHVMRPERVPKNVANSTSVHDLPVPSDKSVGVGKHYRTRVVNDGHIDIIPDPMDTYFGSSSGKDGATNLTNATSAAPENRGRSLDKGWEEQDIPSSTPGFKNANSMSALQNIKFKYRIPEKVIRLDFWSRMQLERHRLAQRLVERERQRARAPIDFLATLANAELSTQVSTSTPQQPLRLAEPETRALVAGIFGSAAHLRQPWVGKGSKEEEEEEEADSCLRETYLKGEWESEFAQDPEAQKAIQPAYPTPPASQESEQAAQAMGMTTEEVSQLKALKTLVEQRGADALLQFAMHGR